jgi:hypothetical protein
LQKRIAFQGINRDASNFAAVHVAPSCSKFRSITGSIRPAGSYAVRPIYTLS